MRHFEIVWKSKFRVSTVLLKFLPHRHFTSLVNPYFLSRLFLSYCFRLCIATIEMRQIRTLRRWNQIYFSNNWNDKERLWNMWIRGSDLEIRRKNVTRQQGEVNQKVRQKSKELKKVEDHDFISFNSVRTYYFWLNNQKSKGQVWKVN